MQKLEIGILGATGIVGQNYIRLLEGHPWFEVSYVAASERSAGKPYLESVSGRWHFKEPIPGIVRDLEVRTVDEIEAAVSSCDFVFSALDTAVAKEYEEKYASAGLPVISNASAHRWTKDVPMLIPEINPEHIEIIPIQQRNRGWEKGFIAVKPNCSLQSYLLPLFALHSQYQIRRAIITTMQAVSGAGHPGVSGFDIIDNIIPYIKGEEEKSELEPLKILGYIEGDEIFPVRDIEISAHCNRVPVLDGHMACVSVEFYRMPNKKEILSAWESYVGVPQELDLPSAPSRPILYNDLPDRPQPRLDRDLEDGMAIAVGRLRECNVLDYRFVGLSHNTVRGAAGGGILNAELLYKKGYLG